MRLKNYLFANAVLLSLSSLLLAPVYANPVQLILADQMNQDVTSEGITRIGRIGRISGSTATVVFRDGPAQDIQISSEDMRSMNLTQDSYVVVRDNRIVGLSRIGRIVSIVGPIVTVKLQDGEIINPHIPPRNSRTEGMGMYLKEGSVVYLFNDRIVAVANKQFDINTDAFKTSN